MGHSELAREALIKSLSCLAFAFSFKARNKGANSEPFKEDYNEALHENTSKIMLCNSTSVPLAFPCMPPQ